MGASIHFPSKEDKPSIPVDLTCLNCLGSLSITVASSKFNALPASTKACAPFAVWPGTSPVPKINWDLSNSLFNNSSVSFLAILNVSSGVW